MSFKKKKKTFALDKGSLVGINMCKRVGKDSS